MKTTIAVGVLALVLIGLVAAGGIVAAKNNGFAGKGEDIAIAIENNDYAGWKTAIEDGLTEENFDAMSERRANFGERRQMMAENHDDIKAAIEADNYLEWRSIMDGLENAPEWTVSITEENFDTLVELHEARELSKELSEELGMPEGKRGMMKFHQRSGDCPLHEEE